MRTVHKYAVPVSDDPRLLRAERVVHVGPSEPGETDIRVWAEVELDSTGEAVSPLRAFRIYGTGHSIPPGAVHVGTVPVGWFVWHLYDVTNAPEAHR
ncbi:MAG: hypothetical protein HOV66_12210 [Streptomycetaceae bacterium]|nr:hypothetical protein [Streptomycetaceae bacterium]